jgi:hypothetical protein
VSAPRRTDVSPRVLVALRIGPATAKEVAALISVPQSVASNSLKKLTRERLVRIAERRKLPCFGKVPSGQLDNRPTCTHWSRSQRPSKAHRLPSMRGLIQTKRNNLAMNNADQKAAAKKRTKIAKPPKQIDPMADDIPERVPREGSSEWHFYQYGKAFARGMTKATGRPFTAPVVAGPQGVMVKLLVAHCRNEDGKLLKGQAVIEWLENVVYDFRSKANERDYGFGNAAWSPSAFARWLDNGRPTTTLARPGSAARAHIAVKQG